METCRATHTWGTGRRTWWRVRRGSLSCCSILLSTVKATSMGKIQHGRGREKERVCCCRKQLVMCAERRHFSGTLPCLFSVWRALDAPVLQWWFDELPLHPVGWFSSTLCASTAQSIALETHLTINCSYRRFRLVLLIHSNIIPLTVYIMGTDFDTHICFVVCVA